MHRTYTYTNTTPLVQKCFVQIVIFYPYTLPGVSYIFKNLLFLQFLTLMARCHILSHFQQFRMKASEMQFLFSGPDIPQSLSFTNLRPLSFLQLHCSNIKKIAHSLDGYFNLKNTSQNRLFQIFWHENQHPENK